MLAGFGNPSSDLDLIVLVESERVTRLPITSHRFSTMVDVSVRQAEPVRDSARRLAEQVWPLAGSVRHPEWSARQRGIDRISRLALGLPLISTPEWAAWLDGLRQPWLADAIRSWWRTEALRLTCAARWLAEANPRLAAVRAREAVMAALEVGMADAGQFYFTPKWLPEKLKAVGDLETLATLRELFTHPGGPEGHRRLLGRCLELAAGLTGPAGDRQAIVWWAPGVRAWPLDDRILVERWGMRAVEVPDTGLPAAPAAGPAAQPAAGAAAEPAAEPVWQGRLDEPPPAAVARLFAHDMLWLAVAPAERGGPS